jgi:hypothetical protein
MMAVVGRNMLREGKGTILSCTVDGNILYEINDISMVIGMGVRLGVQSKYGPCIPRGPKPRMTVLTRASSNLLLHYDNIRD